MQYDTKTTLVKGIYAFPTPLQTCIKTALERYFEMLDGDQPEDLHKIFIGQVEKVLFDYVMRECRGNQSRAAKYLGISRGTLRGKLSKNCVSNTVPDELNGVLK